MEELNEFHARLEGARLQIKSLQRATRTSLQVLTDLEEQAQKLIDALDARSKEDAAHEYYRSHQIAC